MQRGDTKAMLTHLCGIFLLTVARGLAAPQDKALVTRAKAEIDRHPGDDRSLAELAGVYGVHPSTLSKKFRDAEGATLVSYRNARRFQEAFRLLSTGMKPGAVAEKLGFPDYPYFSRFFRRRAGFPPGRMKG
ncbi:MAG: helix-turn-helix transcriptional regulator [Spirochaetes bacterium]|nr:helix-turn-helix transcriptional regulator [Spirochaetota bacterium]